MDVSDEELEYIVDNADVPELVAELELAVVLTLEEAELVLVLDVVELITLLDVVVIDVRLALGTMLEVVVRAVMPVFVALAATLPVELVEVEVEAGV